MKLRCKKRIKACFHQSLCICVCVCKHPFCESVCAAGTKAQWPYLVYKQKDMKCSDHLTGFTVTHLSWLLLLLLHRQSTKVLNWRDSLVREDTTTFKGHLGRWFIFTRGELSHWLSHQWCDFAPFTSAPRLAWIYHNNHYYSGSHINLLSGINSSHLDLLIYSAGELHLERLMACDLGT